MQNPFLPGFEQLPVITSYSIHYTKLYDTLASKQEEASYFILGEELEQTQFLPGIASQSQFMEAAGKELSFAIRNKNELALALLKIDQFERIRNNFV